MISKRNQGRKTALLQRTIGNPFYLFGLRKHLFHCVKDRRHIKFLHATNVIRAAALPMAGRRGVMAKEARHVAENARSR